MEKISENHPPTSEDFQNALNEIFRISEQRGLKSVMVKSGDLHRQVGGYSSKTHRLTTCCQVMRNAMLPGDHILAAPPRGNGATLLVRYRLPRE